MGTVQWTLGKDDEIEEIASIGYSVRPSEDGTLTLKLIYQVTLAGRSEKESVELPVQLEPTPMHFGGSRWWGRCPLAKDGRPCRRRIAKLYLPPGGRYFGCRHCYRLTYKSAQEHDKRVDWFRRNPDALNDVLRKGPKGMSIADLTVVIKALRFGELRASVKLTVSQSSWHVNWSDHPTPLSAHPRVGPMQQAGS
jgi:hypothetical protein